MPIVFEHGPPVAALANLAQHAGAVEAQRKRRAELEAMNMQMLQMRKQEQQQSLNRVFDSWKTQYGAASALQRMKAEQQFRDNMQKRTETQQMKGWEMQQESMDRRAEAGNVAAMKRQQDEFRLRGDEQSIKAADAMNHSILTGIGKGLNKTGQEKLFGIMGQMSDMRASQKIDPQKKPEELRKLMEQAHALERDAVNTILLPGTPGYRTDHGPVTMVVGPQGEDTWVLNYDAKEGWGPAKKRYEDMLGIGETRDLNGDGIDDQVFQGEWSMGANGRPELKNAQWRNVEAGENRGDKYIEWANKILIMKDGQLQLKPGAPRELRQIELSMAEADVEDPARNLRLQIAAEQWYEKNMVPGVKQRTPRAMENILDADLNEGVVLDRGLLPDEPVDQEQLPGEDPSGKMMMNKELIRTPVPPEREPAPQDRAPSQPPGEVNLDDRIKQEISALETAGWDNAQLSAAKIALSIIEQNRDQISPERRMAIKLRIAAQARAIAELGKEGHPPMGSLEGLGGDQVRLEEENKEVERILGFSPFDPAALEAQRN